MAPGNAASVDETPARRSAGEYVLTLDDSERPLGTHLEDAIRPQKLGGEVGCLVRVAVKLAIDPRVGAFALHGSRDALDRYTLGGDDDVGIDGQIGGLARARSAREGEAMFAVVPDTPCRHRMRASVA